MKLKIITILLFTIVTLLILMIEGLLIHGILHIFHGNLSDVIPAVVIGITALLLEVMLTVAVFMKDD